LKRCRTIEKKYDEGTRIAQTRQALEKNESIAQKEMWLRATTKALRTKGCLYRSTGRVIIHGRFPFTCHHILSQILWATSRVLYALTRKHLAAEGPDYLMKRMPEGWITEEMAEILHRYYLTVEPDLAFDVLVSRSQLTSEAWSFEEFKASGDHLYAKILEAQSVDTYYGWFRECIQIGAKHRRI
jgi:hypothetical protein